MAGRASAIRHARVRRDGLDARDVPAMLGPDRPDDRPELGAEDRVLERPAELATMDVAQDAALTAAAGVDRLRRGQGAIVSPAASRRRLALRRCLVGAAGCGGPAAPRGGGSGRDCGRSRRGRRARVTVTPP